MGRTVPCEPGVPALPGFQIARTAVLVCIGELFFRADGLRAGLAMFQKMVTEFSLTTLRDGTIFSLGLDKKIAWWCF